LHNGFNGIVERPAYVVKEVIGACENRLRRGYPDWMNVA
jgi:hypothetical protein